MSPDTAVPSPATSGKQRASTRVCNKVAAGVRLRRHGRAMLRYQGDAGCVDGDGGAVEGGRRQKGCQGRSCGQDSSICEHDYRQEIAQGGRTVMSRRDEDELNATPQGVRHKIRATLLGNPRGPYPIPNDHHPPRIPLSHPDLVTSSDSQDPNLPALILSGQR